MIGNSTAVPLTLNQFIITGLQDWDSVQFFEEDGEIGDFAVWSSTATPPGWHDGYAWPLDAGSYLGGKEISSGKGFFLTCGEDVRVTIPAVNLN